MLVLYITTGAFLIGGGLIIASNLMSSQSNNRYYN